MYQIIYNLLLNAGSFINGMQAANQQVAALRDSLNHLRDSGGAFGSGALDSFYRMEAATNSLRGSFHSLKATMREVFDVGVQSETLDTTISFMAKNIHAEVGDINTAITELTASGQRSILGAKEALKSALSLNIPLDTAVASIKAFSNALASAGKSQDMVVAIFDSVRTMQSQRLDEYGITKNVDQAINDEIRYLQQIKMTGQYVEEYARILGRFNDAGEIRKENLRQEEIQQLAVNNLAREALQLQTSYGAIIEVSQRARTSNKRANDYEADAEAMGIMLVKTHELLEARKKYQALNKGVNDRDANAAVAKDTIYKEDELIKTQQQRHKDAGLKGTTADLYFAGSGDRHKANENFLMAQIVDRAGIPKESIESLKKSIKDGSISQKQLKEFLAEYKISEQTLMENTYAGVSTAALQTTRAKIDILKSSIMQVKADVGSELLKMFSGPISAISELVQWFSTLSSVAKTNLAILLTALTGVLGSLTLILGSLQVFRMFTPVITGLTAAFALMGNTVAFVGGAVRGLVVFILGTAIPAIVSFTSGLVAGVARLLLLPVAAAAVATGFTLIATAAEGLAVALGLVSGLLTGISTLFAALAPLIGGAVGTIVGFVAAINLIPLAIAAFIGLGASIYAIVEAFREYKKLSEGPADQQKGSFWETMKAAMDEVSVAFSGIKASITTFMQALTGNNGGLKEIGASIIKKLADAFAFLGGIFEKVLMMAAAYVSYLRKIWQDPAAQGFFNNIAKLARGVLDVIGWVVKGIWDLNLLMMNVQLKLLEYVAIFGIGDFAASVRKNLNRMKAEYQKLSKELEENRKKQIKEDDEEKNKESRKKKYEEDKSLVATLSTKQSLTSDESKQLEEANKRIKDYESSNDFKVGKTGSTRIEPETPEQARKKVQDNIAFFAELKKLSIYEASNQEDYFEIRRQIYKSNSEEYKKMIGLAFEKGGAEGLKEVLEYRLRGISDAVELFNLTLDKTKKANDSSKKLVAANKELLDTLTSYFYDSKIAIAKRQDDQFASLLERNKSIELAKNNLMSMRKEIELAKAEAMDAAQRVKNEVSIDKIDELESNFKVSIKNIEKLQYNFSASKLALANLIKDFELEQRRQDAGNRLKMSQFEASRDEPRTGTKVIDSYNKQIGAMIDQFRLQSKNGEDLLAEATSQFSGVYNKIFSRISSTVNENYIGTNQALSAYEIMAKNVENSIRKLESSRLNAEGHYNVAKREYERLQELLNINARARVAAEGSGDSVRISKLDKEKLDLEQRLEYFAKNQKEAAVGLADITAMQNSLLSKQLEIAKEKDALANKELNNRMRLLSLEGKVTMAQIKRLNSIGEFEAADKLMSDMGRKHSELQGAFAKREHDRIKRTQENADIIRKNTQNAYKVDDNFHVFGKLIRPVAGQDRGNSALAKTANELSAVQITNPQNVYIGGQELKTLMSGWLNEFGYKADHLNRTYDQKSDIEKRENQKSLDRQRYGINKDSKEQAQESQSKDKTVSATSFVKGPWQLTSAVSTSGTVIHSGHKDHKGIDIAAPIGTPVVSPVDLRVLNAGWQGTFGNAITAEVARGIKMQFAHLNEVSVGQGFVSAGTLLGKVGNTGNSAGSHLHQEMLIDGKAVDEVIQSHILNVLHKNPNISKKSLEDVKNAALMVQNQINEAERRLNGYEARSSNKSLPYESKVAIASSLAGVIKALKDNEPVLAGRSISTSAFQKKQQSALGLGDGDQVVMLNDKGREKIATGSELIDLEKLEARRREVAKAIDNKRNLLDFRTANGFSNEQEVASSRKELDELMREYQKIQKQIGKGYVKDKKGNITGFFGYNLQEKFGQTGSAGSGGNPTPINKAEMESRLKEFESSIDDKVEPVLSRPNSNKLMDAPAITNLLNELYDQRAREAGEFYPLRDAYYSNLKNKESLEKQRDLTKDPTLQKKLDDEIQKTSALIDQQENKLEEVAQRWNKINETITKVTESTSLLTNAVLSSVGKNFDNLGDQISGSFGAAFKAAMTAPTDTRDIRTWWERFSDSYKEAGSSALRDAFANLGSELLAIPQKYAFDSLKEFASTAFKSARSKIISTMTGINEGEVKTALGESQDKAKESQATDAVQTAVSKSTMEVVGAAKKAVDAAKTAADASRAVSTSIAAPNNPQNTSPSGATPIAGQTPPPPSGTPPNQPKVGDAIGNLNSILSTGLMAASLMTTISAFMTKSVSKVDQKIKDVNDVFESNENVKGVVVGEQNIGIGKLNEIFQPIAVDLRVLVNTLSAQFGAMPASAGNLGLANNQLAVTVNGKIDLYLVDSNPNLGNQIRELAYVEIAKGIAGGADSTSS